MRSATHRPAGLRLAVAALVLLPLTACGGQGSGTSEEAGAASGEAGEEQSTTVEVPDTDLTFQTPEDWETLDLSETGATDGEAMQQMAERMGMPPEQFEQQVLQTTDVFVGAPEPVESFLSNIVVIHEESQQQVPSLAQRKRSYQGIGAEVTGGRDVSTPVGDGHLLAYSMPVQETQAHGASIVLQLDGGGAIELTSSAHDAETARSLATQVLDTLAEDG